MLSVAVLAHSADRAAQVCRTIERLGLACESFNDLPALLDALKDRALGLVLLHGVLGPKGAGLQVIRRVRSVAGPSLPMIVADTATVTDLVSVLEAGADALLPKTLSGALLEARMRSLLRRRAYQVLPVPGKLVYGPYCFDRWGHKVTLRGVAVPLRSRDYELALLLFQNLGSLFSRDRIVEAIWPKAVSVTSRTVDNHIFRLRSGLQFSHANGYVLDTVHGNGYRLAPADDWPGVTAATP